MLYSLKSQNGKKIVRMAQKLTKRQNERPPESIETDLRPFRKQVRIYYKKFCNEDVAQMISFFH